MHTFCLCLFLTFILSVQCSAVVLIVPVRLTRVITKKPKTRSTSWCDYIIEQCLPFICGWWFTHLQGGGKKKPKLFTADAINSNEHNYYYQSRAISKM